MSVRAHVLAAAAILTIPIVVDFGDNRQARLRVEVAGDGGSIAVALAP